MRLLSGKGRDRPFANTLRAAERYLTAGAEEARRVGCGFVGTEHMLSALVRDRSGGTAPVLARLGIEPAGVDSELAGRLTGDATRAKIDPEALASLGIDFDAVRARMEETFGPGALERTHASCLGIAPRLKQALAHALDRAGDGPLGDVHVLLGILSVPDSAGARVLARLGVEVDDVEAIVTPDARGR